MCLGCGQVWCSVATCFGVTLKSCCLGLMVFDWRADCQCFKHRGLGCGVIVWLGLSVMFILTNWGCNCKFIFAKSL